MHPAFWRAEIPVWEHESGQQEVMRSPGHLEQMSPLTRRCIQRYLDAYPVGTRSARWIKSRTLLKQAIANLDTSYRRL